MCCDKCTQIKGEEAVSDCCENRTKQRTDDEKKALANRLSRIEGQIRGIRGMLDSDSYCTDILTQVSAAQSALNSFCKELLASHIRHCVVRDIRAGDEAVIDELVLTLQKLMR